MGSTSGRSGGDDRTTAGQMMIKLTVGVLALMLSNVASAAEPLPEVPGSSVGYPTVAKAFEDLSSQPGIRRVIQNGWTVFDDETAHTIWSFAPQGSPPFPSVVKRQIVTEGTGVSIKMDVHCESTKSACDDLVVMFEKLNETVKQQMSQRR